MINIQFVSIKSNPRESYLKNKKSRRYKNVENILGQFHKLFMRYLLITSRNPMSNDCDQIPLNARTAV